MHDLRFEFGIFWLACSIIIFVCYLLKVALADLVKRCTQEAAAGREWTSSKGSSCHLNTLAQGLHTSLTRTVMLLHSQLHGCRQLQQGMHQETQ
jgi:hypothetical protein